MKKNNGKMLAIAALVVAVVGLSIGFAAFSSVLTINTTANVTPDDSEFKVEFQSGYTVTPTGSATVEISAPSTGSDKNKVIWATIEAEMTKPGDVVTVTIPIKNTGNYTAYLKNIEVFEGYSTYPSGSNPSQDLLDAVQDEITQKVSVGNDTNLQNLTADTTVTTTHSLAKGATENLVITYTYPSDGTYVDGDFIMTGFEVKLYFSSAA